MPCDLGKPLPSAPSFILDPGETLHFIIRTPHYLWYLSIRLPSRGKLWPCLLYKIRVAQTNLLLSYFSFSFFLYYLPSPKGNTSKYWGWTGCTLWNRSLIQGSLQSTEILLPVFITCGCSPGGVAKVLYWLLPLTQLSRVQDHSLLLPMANPTLPPLKWGENVALKCCFLPVTEAQQIAPLGEPGRVARHGEWCGNNTMCCFLRKNHKKQFDCGTQNNREILFKNSHYTKDSTKPSSCCYLHYLLNSPQSHLVLYMENKNKRTFLRALEHRFKGVMFITWLVFLTCQGLGTGILLNHWNKYTA